MEEKKWRKKKKHLYRLELECHELRAVTIWWHFFLGVLADACFPCKPSSPTSAPSWQSSGIMWVSFSRVSQIQPCSLTDLVEIKVEQRHCPTPLPKANPTGRIPAPLGTRTKCGGNLTEGISEKSTPFQAVPQVISAGDCQAWYSWEGDVHILWNRLNTG